MSKIIFLNGCGSSGKTSIAKAIGHESPELWLSFGVDTFIDMIPFGRQEPYLKFIPGQNERGPTTHVESGPEGGKLFSVMPQLAEMLATGGNNLIIDEVLFDEEALKAYAKHLKDHTVYYIGVFCDLEVMQEREVLRRDRCIGLSNDQIDRLHQGALNSYDFKVDTTTISPFEAARLILKFVGDNPAGRVCSAKQRRSQSLPLLQIFYSKLSHVFLECSHRSSKPKYLWALWRFSIALDPCFTFSNFVILPPKSPFLPSPSPIHANTRGEGTHVLNALIYLGFRGLVFFDPTLFRERQPE